jgi:SAM-dependent methyltransferase
MSSFDDRAATWDDDPTKVVRARTIADAIRAAVPLTQHTRLLEYGAGTGLLSEELAADVGSITLADPSSGMRNVMATKVEVGRLPAGSRVWDLDLSTAPLPPDRFDLVVSLMTLHHIPDVPPVLAALAEALDPGGRLCVADLVAEDGSFHGEGFEGHRGFVTEDLADQVREVGLADVEVRARVHDVEKNRARYPLFLLTARRPG